MSTRLYVGGLPLSIDEHSVSGDVMVIDVGVCVCAYVCTRVRVHARVRTHACVCV